MGDDSITFTMAEFGEFQTEKLALQHENERLRAKCEELSKAPESLAVSVELKELLRRKLTENGSSESGSRVLSEILELIEKFPHKDTQKAQLDLEGLTEKCRALESSLDSSAAAVSALEAQKENLIVDLAYREEEVTAARESLKGKYSLECSKHELELEAARLMKTIESLNQEVVTLSSQNANSLQEQLTQKAIDLQQAKEQLNESRNNEQLLKLEYSDLKDSTKLRLLELATSQQRITELETKLAAASTQLQQTCLELEDARTEKQIVQKRSMHDLKDLKIELNKEKTAHSKCSLENETLLQDTRRLLERQRSYSRSSGTATVHEKIIIEDLSLRVAELDLENHTLRSEHIEANKLQGELEQTQEENTVLRKEIDQLQVDLANLGASFNEMIRSGNFK